MSGGAFITYRKGLKLWQRYCIRFTLAGAASSWNYLRFEFLKEDGSLCAAGYMKGAAVGRDGLVPNQRSYAKLDRVFVQSELPRPVRHWLAAEAGVMGAGETAP